MNKISPPHHHSWILHSQICMWDPATSLNFRLCKTCHNPQASASVGSFPLSTSSSRTGLVANLRSAEQQKINRQLEKKSYGILNLIIKMIVMSWYPEIHPLTSSDIFSMHLDVLPCSDQIVQENWRIIHPSPFVPNYQSGAQLTSDQAGRTSAPHFNSSIPCIPRKAMSGNKKHATVVYIWLHTCFPFLGPKWTYKECMFHLHILTKLSKNTIIHRHPCLCALGLAWVLPPLSQFVAAGSGQTSMSYPSLIWLTVFCLGNLGPKKQNHALIDRLPPHFFCFFLTCAIISPGMFLGII